MPRRGMYRSTRRGFAPSQPKILKCYQLVHGRGWGLWFERGRTYSVTNTRLQGSTGGILHSWVHARTRMGEVQGRATPGGLRYDFPCATLRYDLPCATWCKREAQGFGSER